MVDAMNDARTRAQHLKASLTEDLRKRRAEAREMPMLNPIQAAAVDLARRIAAKEIKPADVAALLQLLAVDGFHARARWSAAYVGDLDRANNEAAMRERIEAFAKKDGEIVPFEAFKAAVERELYAVVFTAHPTFSLSRSDFDDLAAMIAAAPEAADADARLFERPHHPQTDIDLASEHDQVASAIQNAQAALARLHGAVLDTAEALYPGRAAEITPRLMSVANWVGYDLDGRQDITWATTLAFRLEDGAEALRRAQAKLSEARAFAGGDHAFEASLDALDAQFERTRRRFENALRKAPEDIHDAAQVAAFSKALVDTDGRLTPKSALAEIAKLRRAAPTPDTARTLGVLAAQIAGSGFSTARIHMRINANQLHNAIRPAIEMEGEPDAPADRRRWVNLISELINTAKPHTVNLGSIMREIASAKRTFMVIATILKHIDPDTPIRFLIAESDTPFTVLTAIYFARLFGVEDSIEICPLFETDEGLDRGASVLAELLDNPHYCDYVRRMGRLCVQTGYSDAGRFIGQIPGGLSIERLRMKLGRSWREFDLGDVELVIFDTHGESIGRGGHPGSFEDRLLYVHSHAARALFAEQGVRYRQETSFQGGDGYVWHARPELSLATITRLFLAASKPADTTPDAFYKDVDWSLDFFKSILEFQQALADDPGYVGVLGAFGPNLLYPTGSRMTLRQREGKTAAPSFEKLSQIRAIPNNAILQQMGYMANTLGGVGSTIEKDPDGFDRVKRGSARMTHLLAIVRAARELSDFDRLRAYVDLRHSAYWLSRAHGEATPVERPWMRRVAALLETAPAQQTDMRRLMRRLFADTVAAKDILPEAEGLDAETAETMDLVHVVRIALIERIFRLAAMIPRFASVQGVAIDDYARRILRLDVESSIADLREIFPVGASNGDDTDFGEPSDFTPGAAGYARVHAELLDPIEQLYDLSRLAGVTLANFHHAIG